MKTIGLVGGMSWESTATYYRIINETVRDYLGGLHSARIILHSFNFHEIEGLQRRGAWAEAVEMLAGAARSLRAAGADFFMICTNTMHRDADEIERAAGMPLLHIVDPAAEKIKAAGLRRVGLLGTLFTMEQGFYQERLLKRHGIEAIIPGSSSDREIVHRIIFEELCRGVVLEQSRREFRRIIRELAAAGAGGIILGCTEITMLAGEQDSPVPVFDTAIIHARKAAAMSLKS